MKEMKAKKKLRDVENIEELTKQVNRATKLLIGAKETLVLAEKIATEITDKIDPTSALTKEEEDLQLAMACMMLQLGLLRGTPFRPGSTQAKRIEPYLEAVKAGVI